MLFTRVSLPMHAFGLAVDRQQSLCPSLLVADIVLWLNDFMAANLFNTLSSGSPYDYSAAFCDSERFNWHGFSRPRKSSLASWYSPSSSKRSDPNQRAKKHKRLRDHKKFELFRLEEKTKENRDLEKGFLVRGKKELTDEALSRSQRFSLLGRPIETPVVRHRTRDQIIRKYQFIVHNFLERPRGKIAVSYHIFL